MNQIKIGRFISECRKKEGLTQIQLAEKLHVTDRAVSKWETGKSMPDSSIMLELCSMLRISVNDLLNGEVIAMDNYNKEMEKTLIEMVKEKEESDKRLLALELVIGALSCSTLLIATVIGGLVPVEQEWIRVVIVLLGFISFFIGVGVALKIEQVAGYYECNVCNYKYVPTFKAVNLAPHMGRTRYMRCPKCNQKSWQKKVISKE